MNVLNWINEIEIKKLEIVKRYFEQNELYAQSKLQKDYSGNCSSTPSNAASQSTAFFKTSKEQNLEFYKQAFMKSVDLFNRINKSSFLK